MDWREFFMSRDAYQSVKLNELADAMTTHGLRSKKGERSLDSLGHDVGLLILLQLLTLRTLMDAGILKREDLHARMMELDKLDGLGDGKVSPDALKRIIGLWMAGEQEGQGPSDVRKV